MRNFGDESWSDRFLVVYVAIAAMRNFGNDGWGDRFFRVIMLRSLLCGILEMRIGAIGFFG
jgi:hypothetical protein